MSKALKGIKINRFDMCRYFQINGFILKSDAINLMENELINGFPPYESLEHFTRQITPILMMKCKSDSFIINSNDVQMAIDHLRRSRNSQRSANHEFIVKNVICDDEKQSNFINHYNTLYKNLSKHKLFQTQFKLTQIDTLMSCVHSLDCIVLGFLRTDKSKVTKHYILEDPTGVVPIVFNEDTQWRDKIIAENTFVLCEGTYTAIGEYDVLLTNAIGNPPLSIDSSHTEDESVTRDGRMIIILYDIHLDDSDTLEKLKILFTGYNAIDPVPDAFIFIGNFLSDQNTEMENFKRHMKNFIKVISAFRNITRDSQMIFVPGNDLSDETIPKSPFTSEMFPYSTSKLNNFYLSTNPVNIYIDDRHISLFGYPYLSKFKKLIIHDATENSIDYGTSLGRIIISNAHVTPALNKSFPNSLSLWHVPDLLILADKSTQNQFDCNIYNHTKFITLPSFSNDGFKFKVYYTQQNTTEDSQILV